MEIRELSAQRRDGIGKIAVRRLRRLGLVPGVVYGARSEPIPLSLPPKEVLHALHGHGGGSALINLRLAGESEPRAAIIRELQFDPVRESLLHVDLQAVRMDEEITVETPIHVVGEAVGVKEQKGILSVLLRAVEVSCLPSAIPERFDVDVSGLRIHDVVMVSDLPLPEGVKVTTPPTHPIVTVAPPTVEAVEAPAAPEAEAGAEPKAGEEAAGGAAAED